MQNLLRRIHFGTMLGIVVAIYIAIYLIETVHHNYQLQQQIGGLQKQLDTVQNQKQTLQYKIQYYQTDDYKEKEARAKLNLQAPGEGVVILPHDEKTTPVPDETEKKVVAPKSHWQQWADFLTGKG